MTLTLTVHRGTAQIGGSCIEIATPRGDRLILDAGRPLDAPRDARGLLPASLDLSRPAAVVFSHPHMDHWGLIDELPADWPIWTGEKSAELIRLTTALFGAPLNRPIHTWRSRAGPLAIGEFKVTPMLTDHSAFDAYMLLIEDQGDRLLYTGDFRNHGRKAKLVDRIMSDPPPNIDVLLMEGTNLRSDKPVVTESELENHFVEVANRTQRHLFVNWSAQNIDRTVTLYRAALRSGRELVVDLYGADVLKRIAEGSRVPRPGPDFPALKILITTSGKRLFARQGRKTEANAIADDRSVAVSRRGMASRRAIIMFRDSMLREFDEGGLGFTPRDTYVLSSWSGYLDPMDPKSGWSRAGAAGARTLKLHTSGHASPHALADFASAIAPKALIPVHGVMWDDPGIALPPVVRLRDGEAWRLP